MRLFKIFIATILIFISFDIMNNKEYTDIVKIEDTYTIEVEEITDIPSYDPDEEDVTAIARTLYGECRGVECTMEKAAVAWVVLNRVDADYGDTVLDVVSAPNQFDGYDPNHPVTEELYAIAEDVLIRWNREKIGEEDVGRVIPPEYVYFAGDGDNNYFRKEYRSNEYWDWSLKNPYE